MLRTNISTSWIVGLRISINMRILLLLSISSKKKIGIGVSFKERVYSMFMTTLVKDNSTVQNQPDDNSRVKYYCEDNLKI